MRGSPRRSAELCQRNHRPDGGAVLGVVARPGFRPVAFFFHILQDQGDGAALDGPRCRPRFSSARRANRQIAQRQVANAGIFRLQQPGEWIGVEFCFPGHGWTATSMLQRTALKFNRPRGNEFHAEGMSKRHSLPGVERSLGYLCSDAPRRVKTAFGQPWSTPRSDTP